MNEQLMNQNDDWGEHKSIEEQHSEECDCGETYAGCDRGWRP